MVSGTAAGSQLTSGLSLGWELLEVQRGGTKGGGAARLSVNVVVPNGGPHSHGSTGARVDGELQALQNRSGAVASGVSTMVARADVEAEAWRVQQQQRRRRRSERGGDAPDSNETGAAVTRGAVRLAVVWQWSRWMMGEKVGRGEAWQGGRVTG
jgi:hypothetical protein